MDIASTPRSRSERFLVQPVGSELVALDKDTHTALRLNETAALVWQNADGTRTVSDLVALLSDQLGEFADEDLVMVTIDRLAEHGLLETPDRPRDAEESRYSRRRMVKRMAAVGAAAAVLPVVQQVIVPSSAAAQSVVKGP
jgi:hypothetical protein